MLNKLLPIIMIITLTSCHQLNQKFGFKDDNPIEEAIEEVVEETTGAHLELTPKKPFPPIPQPHPCDQVEVPYKQ